MGIKCEFVLNVAKGTIYKSGDPVRGTLQFRLNKRKQIFGINLHLKGKGRCQWVKNNGYVSITYIGQEEYVFQTKPIVQNSHYIEAGEYAYPFEFLLPHGLPSMFANLRCKIAYRIIAEFRTTGLFGDTKFEVEIPVHGYVEPCSPQPLLFSLSKRLFSLTSPRNTIEIAVEIEKTLISPGENINLIFFVNNLTGVLIKGFKMEIIKEITCYTTGGDSKYTKKKAVCEWVVMHPDLKETGVTSASCVVPTPPTLYSVQNSKILSREFKLQVTAVLPLPHTNASVDIPIVIGIRR